MGITLTEDNVKYILNIIDNNIKMHREKNRMYCIQPNKRCDSDGNIICDSECYKCTNDFYEEYRKEMITKSGLEAVE